MKKLRSKIELDEIQRRNLKKIIKRERSLIETTPKLEKPLFVEQKCDG